MNKDYFECFSRKLYGYLTMMGFSYEKTYVHKKTGRRCYVYKMNNELSKCLTKWTNNEN